MEELLALQAELAKVQEAPSAFKLSEPNIVEIVSTMCEAGLLEVLFTTNGKEYLTPTQLRNEVEDEIVAHGGRINVVELPTILNVDLPHVERAVESLFREGRDGLQRVGGELITDYYLDSLAEEVRGLSTCLVALYWSRPCDTFPPFHVLDKARGESGLSSTQTDSMTPSSHSATVDCASFFTQI